jgi:hypothetical protein
LEGKAFPSEITESKMKAAFAQLERVFTAPVMETFGEDGIVHGVGINKTTAYPKEAAFRTLFVKLAKSCDDFEKEKAANALSQPTGGVSAPSAPAELSMLSEKQLSRLAALTPALMHYDVNVLVKKAVGYRRMFILRIDLCDVLFINCRRIARKMTPQPLRKQTERSLKQSAPARKIRQWTTC